MTSPRQRKKRLRLKLAKEKQEATLSKPEVKENTKSAETVASTPTPVVESANTLKAKKLKNALVETKPQDQVVEQQKVEVKTETKE